MSEPEYYAVLTGDIVKSSRLADGELEAVRAKLLAAIDDVKGWKRGLVRGKPEFFRGDAWQALLKDPGAALRAAAYVRARLLADGRADTRVSIGLGTVEKISSGRISLSTGEAFALSGHGLDEMTQYNRMTIVSPENVGALGSWLTVAAQLCDALIRQWTQRQAEIACRAIRPDDPTHEDIAQTLSPIVSKQAVTKALAGANWHVLQEAIHQFHETPWTKVLNPEG